jgi:hypothetical protein
MTAFQGCPAIYWKLVTVSFSWSQSFEMWLCIYPHLPTGAGFSGVPGVVRYSERYSLNHMAHSGIFGWAAWLRPWAAPRVSSTASLVGLRFATSQANICEKVLLNCGDDRLIIYSEEPLNQISYTASGHSIPANQRALSANSRR